MTIYQYAAVSTADGISQISGPAHFFHGSDCDGQVGKTPSGVKPCFCFAWQATVFASAQNTTLMAHQYYTAVSSKNTVKIEEGRGGELCGIITSDANDVLYVVRKTLYYNDVYFWVGLILFPSRVYRLASITRALFMTLYLGTVFSSRPKYFAGMYCY